MRAMPSSFTVGRVAGIRIEIHYTWLFGFALITWSLASYFPSTVRAAPSVTYWMMGACAALLLFASVLLHELSHSFVARQRGLRVDSITLFIFGGVSNLSSEPTRPGDELLVAVVGPLTSLALGAMCWVLTSASVGGVAGALLGYLSLANLVLGVFNLIPGFPLDGGRVLRGAVWAASGDLRLATGVASFTGQTIGYLLMVFGVVTLLGGDLLGGAWMALIGWFLTMAAQASRQTQAVREALCEIPVSSIMDEAPRRCSPQATVEVFVLQCVTARAQRAALVMDGEQLMGMVTVSDVKKMPRARWALTQLARIMSCPPLATVAPATNLAYALELMQARGVQQLPVLEGERVVGMITRPDIQQVLQFRTELDPLRPDKPRMQSAAGRPHG
jgi:Zn-dependent protease/predicted transcriptional regulator